MIVGAYLSIMMNLFPFVKWNWNTLAGQAIAGMRSMVYPDICVICLKNLPAPSSAICQSCRVSLSFIPSPGCRGCGGMLDTALDQCGECLRIPRPWGRGYSIFNFDGIARQLVHRFKYHGDVALVRLWSAEMNTVLSSQANAGAYDIITAVPLHWLKKMRRGFNQAEMIAHEISPLLGIKVLPLLKRRKWTRPQASLNLTQRQANLKNAFAVKADAPVKDARILLIDDVFTTGSTLTACTNVLLTAGAGSVDVLTIARG
jgi:ComF family protein